MNTRRLLVLAGWMLAAAARAGAGPQLLSPPDGMELTDVAAYFQWLPVPGCTNFEIQIAADHDFARIVREKKTTNRRYHENLYFPKDVLPAGAYFWRVRAMPTGATGDWSAASGFTVNTNRAVAPATVRPLGPEHPIFLMRNRAWDPVAHPEHVREIIPPGLEHVIVVDDIKLASAEVFARARKYEDLGVDFVVWNNRAQVSLATIEFLFQRFRHCIGTAEGEHFWGWEWERGPEGNLSEQDFVRRAWALCGKYGRFYFEGEGEASRYQWTTISRDHREDLQRYRRHIVPMFKSTIGNVALHSIGAVEGLLAAGWVENTGLWADEFVWGECGFGALGELDQDPGASLKQWGTKQCPWTYDLQLWLMGIASGATAFQLESAHQWKADGTAAEHYTRFFLPFVKAVTEHRLLPSRAAFRDRLRVAVACDYERAKAKHNGSLAPDFQFLQDLYAFRHKPFQEIIPDESRYGLIALLPPGVTNLPGPARVVAQADLADPARTRELLDAAYPKRFDGDAFMWECDGTLIVTCTRENEEATQRFAMPLAGGLVKVLAGEIDTQQLLIGKHSADSLWLQAHSERPAREIRLRLTCARRPAVEVAPAAAVIKNDWDEDAKMLSLRLSCAAGAAEVALK